ncbi:hypothetical protein HanIR_Chr14g0712191 [Helianthus annuus]|nr:hypothetical protein HanIR_Chr14g0712191 [Helianthus annuus]
MGRGSRGSADLNCENLLGILYIKKRFLLEKKKHDLDSLVVEDSEQWWIQDFFSGAICGLNQTFKGLNFLYKI